MCGSKELMEQKSRGVVTSADLHPSQEIPAKSPWRLGESLDVSRPAQPSSSRAPAAAVGGRGELGSLLGSPVLSPCRMSFSQQFCVPVCCWGVGIPRTGAGLCPAFFQPQWLPAVGALVLYPSSSTVQDPSPSLGSTGWLCFGMAVGIMGMLKGHWDDEPCCLPLLNPSQGCQGGGGQVFRFGFRSPTQTPHNLLQLPHLGAGCAQVPINIWVPVP